MKRIAIIGSGSWGVALAIHLAKLGNEVRIWSFSEEEANLINQYKKCKFLPDVVLPEKITCSLDYEEVIWGSELVLHATPSKFVRSTVKAYKRYITSQPVLMCSKGFEQETLSTLVDVLKEEMPFAKTGVLSGPSHAEEVAVGIPTALVIASEHESIVELVRTTFMNENMRIYSSTDVKGVELRRSFKKYYCFLRWNCSRDWFR